MFAIFLAFLLLFIQIGIVEYQSLVYPDIHRLRFTDLYDEVQLKMKCEGDAEFCPRNYLSQFEQEILVSGQFFNAFAFQFYYLQVIQTLRSEYGEHQGFIAKENDSEVKKAKYPCSKCCSASFSLGLNTVLSLFLIYSVILSTMFVSLRESDEVTKDKTLRDRLIMWSVIEASMGFNTTNYREWPLIAAIQFCLIFQLFLHIPFIYYIGKENILVLVDELINESTSMMVDRIHLENGDPRFFLAELQPSDSKSEDGSEM